MEFLVYILPLILAIILAVFLSKRMVWWEYALIIFGSTLLSLIISAIMREANTADIEYLGNYVTKVRHYDPWDEWIEKRCTREVPVGRDKDGNTIYETETYDCSYRQYHDHAWTYYTSRNTEYYIKQETFDYIRNRFGTPSIFVDMHRHYYRIDGDAQDYMWPQTINTAQTLTTEHTYKNKIKNSHSIFKYTDISKKKADTLGLFEYPRINDVWKLDQNPILAARNTFYPTKGEIDTVKFINGYYGGKKQFRVFILLFPQDAEQEISEYQKSYWQGGNKNELVVCVCATPGREVKWCNVFSWEDAPKMAVATREWITEHRDSLSLSQLALNMEQNLNANYWKRKEFKDFKYIHTSLKRWQEILLTILSLLGALGIGYYCITNEYENEQ